MQLKITKHRTMKNVGCIIAEEVDGTALVYVEFARNGAGITLSWHRGLLTSDSEYEEIKNCIQAKGLTSNKVLSGILNKHYSSEY